VPPVQAEALIAHRGTPSKWSVAMSLDDMDKAGVDTAVVSVLNPGVWFGQKDEAARRLARACNEYAADLERDHKGRFRSFAVIPLPDTEGALREIEYSLDVLKAQGIALWTSYSEKYLGDPAFLPVFEELNRRKAVVYTHPTVPDCCAGLIKGLPVSTLEYAHDTTRTIASLVFGEGQTATRYPDVQYIWSHSGGTLPFLTSRFVELAGRMKERMPNGPMPIFQRFYYEVAQGNTPGQLAALMEMVNISQVMFGSDYPFRKGAEATRWLVPSVSTFPAESNAQPVISPTAPSWRSASASCRVMMPSCTRAAESPTAPTPTKLTSVRSTRSKRLFTEARLVRSSRSSTERAMTGSGIG